MAADHGPFDVMAVCSHAVHVSPDAAKQGCQTKSIVTHVTANTCHSVNVHRRIAGMMLLGRTASSTVMAEHKKAALYRNVWTYNGTDMSWPAAIRALFAVHC